MSGPGNRTSKALYLFPQRNLVYHYNMCKTESNKKAETPCIQTQRCSAIQSVQKPVSDWPEQEPLLGSVSNEYLNNTRPFIVLLFFFCRFFWAVCKPCALPPPSGLKCNLNDTLNSSKQTLMSQWKKKFKPPEFSYYDIKISLLRLG